MGYEQLSLTSFVNEIKEVTYGAHPRRFCFILGAGASRSSGIKSGQELVKIWDRDLRERNEEEYNRWRKELSITDENMSSFYSQYYEKRFRRCRADGYNYIEKLMESAKPSAGYVMLAHMLTHTPHNVVITTNFDHLTEDAVNYYAQNTPLVIGHEALSHYVSGQQIRPTVIKIHRDLLFDPKSRTEDLERLPESWKTALRLIFTNYHPVFIGYAGNDKSLMDFLVENSDRFKLDEWKYPYWLIYKSDSIEGKVSGFLEKSDGFVVSHGGFDEVMIRLGAAFDYEIPKEDEFLEDARKRYKALAGAIDAISDADKLPGISDDAGKSSEVIKKTVEEDEEKEEFNQAVEKITNNSDVQRMYRDSMNHFDKRNYNDAVEILQQLVQMDPRNTRYHSSLGDALRRLHKYEEALRAYRTAAELEVDNAWYHHKIASVLEDMDMLDEAIKEYRMAVIIEPEFEIWHYMLASALEKNRKYDDALSEYQMAVELDPDDCFNHYGTAKMLVEMDRYKEALQAIQMAIDIEPQYELFYELLSDILHALGLHEEAERAAQKAKDISDKRRSA